MSDEQQSPVGDGQRLMISHKNWWRNEGCMESPDLDESLSSFVFRMTRIAWSNGAYKAVELGLSLEDV